jgi:hypothetical protein
MSDKHIVTVKNGNSGFAWGPAIVITALLAGVFLFIPAVGFFIGTFFKLAFGLIGGLIGLVFGLVGAVIGGVAALIGGLFAMVGVTLAFAFVLLPVLAAIAILVGIGVLIGRSERSH